MGKPHTKWGVAQAMERNENRWSQRPAKQIRDDEPRLAVLVLQKFCITNCEIATVLVSFETHAILQLVPA